MIYKFIEQRVGKIFKSSFLRNVLLVAGGTAGAQAITMLFVPIVTRLYGPEAFGVQGTFMAILSVLTPIAAFTYPIAMVLPKEDKHAIGLAKISIAICLAFSILLAILLFLLGDYLVNLLNIESIGAYLWLLPIAMVLSALHQILSQWLIRKKEFKQTAKAAIYQALTVNLTKVGFGLLSPLAIVLVVISAIANGIHALYLYLGLKKKEILVQAAYDLDTNRLATLDLAKKHKDFPLYRMPQVFLNAVSQSLPVLLLATFFGPASAGFYALSKTVMGLPSMLIGKSVSDVFYPKITEAAHKGESIKPLLMKATNAMALVGFIPFALIVFAGAFYFHLLLVVIGLKQGSMVVG